jgi:hypothetical protein
MTLPPPHPPGLRPRPGRGTSGSPPVPEVIGGEEGGRERAGESPCVDDGGLYPCPLPKTDYTYGSHNSKSFCAI